MKNAPNLDNLARIGPVLISLGGLLVQYSRSFHNGDTKTIRTVFRTEVTSSLSRYGS
jgi:hypothetical protein